MPPSRSGAALGQRHGAGSYSLIVNAARIEVTAWQEGGDWSARLVSPPARWREEMPLIVNGTLALFDWTAADLDPAIPPARISAGADHLLLPLADRGRLAAMQYDQRIGAEMMEHGGWVTIMLIWREAPDRFHARNAFASGGVYEDPATGAAAAALGGYLRDRGLHHGAFDILQGEDMGQPSLIHVSPLPAAGAGCEVSGSVRPLD